MKTYKLGKTANQPLDNLCAAAPSQKFGTTKSVLKHSEDFQSILYEQIDPAAPKELPDPPNCFEDLNLDRTVAAITASHEKYNLKPFFHMPLHTVDTITYRHEIMRDLERADIYKCVTAFSDSMRVMRDHLVQAGKLYHPLQKQPWLLDAVELYCEAIRRFVEDLGKARPQSRGLHAFLFFLREYAKSTGFMALIGEIESTKSALSEVRYAILMKGDTFTVRPYDDAIDYSSAVEQTFLKFKQGTVKDYRVKFPEDPRMNHIEEKVLEFVSYLFPEPFSRLEKFCTENPDYLNETIAAFDREIQFYVSYLDFTAKLKQAGLSFCYPTVSNTNKHISASETFDIALADKLVAERATIVCNDFYLKDNERIFIVSGPNQGGKTTFARTFGQLHYLASLGCPVPGREAQLFLFDNLFTHFEKEEDMKTLRGKLEDDLFRIHHVLEASTTNSIIVLNEIFTSTTLQDALFLSKKILRRIIDLDLLCVCVTFIDELSSLSEQTVSLVSTVIPDNPASRTFKILRKLADGLAYAMSIAEKYRVTYQHLKERIKV